MTLELTRDDYELILLALGYGTGAAILKGDVRGFRMTIAAANAFGKAGGGSFRPYDIGAEVAAFEEAKQQNRIKEAKS